MKERIWNIGWLSLEPATRLLISVSVSIALARHLGPSDFGVLAYILSIVALLTPVVTFGLDKLSLRNSARTPERAGRELGSAVLIRTVAAFAGLALAFLFSQIAGGPPGAETGLIMLGAAAFLFFPFQSVGIYFNSIEKPRVMAVSRTCVITLGASATVMLIAGNSQVTGFVLIRTAEAALLGMVVLVLFLARRKSQARLEADWPTVRTLLRGGLPLMLSAMATMLYIRVDQVMLGVMGAPDQLGSYAVSARIAEAVGFLPMAIQTALMPALVRAHRAGEEELDGAMRRYFAASTIVLLALIPAVGLGAELLVMLFLPEFGSSPEIAWVLLLGLPLVGLSVAQNSLFTVKGWLWTNCIILSIGAALNVIANLMLIPAYGAVGAAIATLLSQACIVMGAGLLFPWTRGVTLSMTRSILGLAYWREINPRVLMRR